MIIEAGKYYKNRRGDKRGPIHAYVQSISGDYVWSDGSLTYRSSGLHTPEAPELDLISLWSEAPTSPVREVTKREIVDGTYSRVFVYKVWNMPKKVAVAFVKAGEEGHVDTPAFVLDATELRTAAAVLLELAGALDA